MSLCSSLAFFACGLVLLVSWTSDMAVAQQLDPVQNMCLRFSHQAVIKNNKLYIDGGLQNFVDLVDGIQQLQGSITQGYNYYLIVIDLSKPWDWHTNVTENAQEKTADLQTGTTPPSLTSGALYQGGNDSKIYLYGGTTSWRNTSFPGFEAPTPIAYSLWSYDTASLTWDQYDITSGSPWRPSNGAYAEAPDQGLAFYFNGELDSGSSTETQDLGDGIKVFLEGMIVINTVNQTATNVSTSGVSGDQPRTRGTLSYIPDVGVNGILVALGGTYKSVDQLDNEESVNINFVSLSEVDVYDISSYYVNHDTGNSTWYKQNTTGDIPPSRAEFCTVMVSAPDGSSHNLYIYGGLGPSNSYYDDIYVLSIPSFTWTQIYGNGTSPRYGHTCHLAGGRSMITVGGALGPSASEDPCDWELKGIGILDLSEVAWGSVYNPDNGTYQVPRQIVSKIGGNVNGSATMTQPAGGFSDSRIASLFGVASSTNSTAPSQPSSQPSLEPGSVPRPRNKTRTVIAGAVGGVGGVLVVVSVIACTWARIRARRRGPVVSEGSGPSDPAHYSVGIICALALEKAAVVAMLDEEYTRQISFPNDTNEYTLGRMGEHDVVVACIGAGTMGKSAAAVVATHMQRSFDQLKVGLMVGIGGGVWSTSADVRLGDIVVSEPNGIHGGVVQWDYGKHEVGGFRRTGTLNKPPAVLLSAVEALKAKHEGEGNQIAENLSSMRRRAEADYRHKGVDSDRLFEADYNGDHELTSTCDECSDDKVVERTSRGNTDPVIHYGTIASGDQVVKNGEYRDLMACALGAICFEMEAAGLMDTFPCIVIRGICDYADAHKNKQWQTYAAATAAAYAKEFLGTLTQRGVEVLAPARTHHSVKRRLGPKFGFLRVFR